jgi:hypothetical protein
MVYTRVERSDGAFDCSIALPYFDELGSPPRRRSYHHEWTEPAGGRGPEIRDHNARFLERSIRKHLQFRKVILVREEGNLVARSEDRR